MERPEEGFVKVLALRALTARDPEVRAREQEAGTMAKIMWHQARVGSSRQAQ
jgi:hypothetical protein